MGIYQNQIAAVSVQKAMMETIAVITLMIVNQILVLMVEHVWMKWLIIPVTVHLVLLGNTAQLISVSLIHVKMEEHAILLEMITIAHVDQVILVKTVQSILTLTTVYLIHVKMEEFAWMWRAVISPADVQRVILERSAMMAALLVSLKSTSH